LALLSFNRWRLFRDTTELLLNNPIIYLYEYLEHFSERSICRLMEVSGIVPLEAIANPG